MENEVNSDGQIVGIKFTYLIPLKMNWKPKEDITTYELALCIPFFFRHAVMPYEVDKSLSHFRHFEIIDNNIKNEEVNE